MIKPRGVVPAMLSIFNKDGSVDVEGQKAFAEWLIQKGVHGLSPCGTTGEGAGLADDERVMIAKAAVDQAAGRVPVVAGLIHYSTRLALNLAKAYVDVGVDALMVLLPYYYKPAIPAAMDYLRSVSKAVNQPLMLYNNPWYAGYELTPKQIKELADEGVLNSVKAAHGDSMRVNYTKYLCGDDVSVLYGHDYAPLESFVVGADGWLSGLPNLLPDLSAQLFEAMDKEHDLEKAQRIWKRMQPVAYYFMYEREKEDRSPHWLSVFKEGIAMLGQDIGLPRLPTGKLADEERKVLQYYLAKVYPDQVDPPK